MVPYYNSIYLPIILGLGLYGNTAEAMYSAHWPGTILLFSIAINQIKRQ
jgi:hypothetical protein